MIRRLILWPLALALLSVSLTSWGAGFGINATRLIYPQGAGSISVGVRNTQNDAPFLVQVALSSKQDQRSPAPFIVTPPLFRLEPNSTNTLRIALTGAPLSSSRESVFYFHATAIPSSQPTEASAAGSGIQGKVQFGVGNIIKLFYRPAGLPGSAAAAQKDLIFSRVPGGMQVSNNSPYFVSLASLKVGPLPLPLETPAQLMLAPFGSHIWSLSKPPVTGERVHWQTINDNGGKDAFSTPLP
ncbi:pilus assembly protein PapD [Enterobacterales bacterium CwR94]|nr:pilus assembly protein PapD [Enterobacterales bacterium CwR94]